MTELAKVENQNLLEIFTNNGIDPILRAIKEKVSGFVPDMSTAKGRKEIASLAHEIARSKTYLDSKGKGLKDQWKKKTDLVDEARRKIKKELDELKESIRAPLTVWENTEKERVEKHKKNLGEFLQIAMYLQEDEISSEELKYKMEELFKMSTGEEWFEFQLEAKKKKEEALEIIKDRISRMEKYEKEQKDLDVLRKEKEEREKKNYEEKIKQQAAKEAKQEAEKVAKEKAEKEKQKSLEKERKVQLLIDKAKLEKAQALEREARAKERQKEMEIEKINEEKNRVKELARQKEEVVKKERDRVESEKKKQEEEQKKREADRKHKAFINNAAVDAIIKNCGIEKAQAVEVVKSVAKNLIPNIGIRY